MGFEVASKIENSIQQNLDKAWDQLPILMDGIGFLVGTAVGLYFVMVVLSYMWTGKATQLPAMDLFKRFFFLALVVSVAFNVGVYISWVKEPVIEIPNSLAMLLSNNSEASASTIDNMMDQNLNLILQIWNQITDIGLWDFSISLLMDIILSVIVILVLGTSYVIIAFSYLMVAKVLINVILLIGPIFIMFSFFQPTREYFTKWIGQLLNYIFLVAIFAAVFTLLNNVILGVITGNNYITKDGVQADSLLFQLLFLYLLFIAVIMAVPTLASSLTGGVGISPFGSVAQLGGGVGRLAGGLKLGGGGGGGGGGVGSLGGKLG